MRWSHVNVPGKSVVVEGGRRGVLHGGKSAVYNAEGICTVCCAGLDCGCCHDRTPASIEVQITGVEWCECIPYWNMSLKIITPPSVSPNGTFVLNQNPRNPCHWYNSYFCDGLIRQYNNTTCEEPQTDEYNIIAMTIEAFACSPWIDAWHLRMAYVWHQPIADLGAFFGGAPIEDYECFKPYEAQNFMACEGGPGIGLYGELVAATNGGVALLNPPS